MSRSTRRPFNGRFGSWVPEDEKAQQRLLIIQSHFKKFLQSLEGYGIVVEASVVPYLGAVDLFREIKATPVLTIDGTEVVIMHKIRYGRHSTDTGRGERYVKKAESIKKVYKSKPYARRFKTISYGDRSRIK